MQNYFAQIERYRKFGDVTPASAGDVAFTYDLCADGALFELFKEKKHTAIDIVKAKKFLIENRDVVRIRVTDVSRASELVCNQP